MRLRRSRGACPATNAPPLFLGLPAGALAVLVAPQGAVWRLRVGGFVANPPSSWRATPPVGVPAALNPARWGGPPGLALALLLRPTGWCSLPTGPVFGALAASLVAPATVPVAKRPPPFAGADVSRLRRGPTHNGGLGWRTAILRRRRGVRLRP